MALLDWAQRELDTRLGLPLKTWLHGNEKPPQVESALQQFEQRTGIAREKLAYGLIAICGVYFVVGQLAQIVCNLIGFAYPAYASVKAVRSPNKEDDTQWLTYWTVYAAFSIFDLSTFSYIPFYWLAKVIFLLWLYLPATRGANIVYSTYLDPLCTRFDRIIGVESPEKRK